MVKKTRPTRLFLFVLPILALFAGLMMTAHRTASAFPLGVVGRSGNPAHNNGATCAACHQGGDIPSVVLIGPTEVAPGETAQYVLQISGGPAQTGGLNVSATDGALVAGGDTQLLSGEITHLEPKAFSDGIVTFSFSWTAPNTPGSVSMYGAGNSTNADFDTSGDGATGSSISISVVAAAEEPPADGGAGGDGGVGDGGAGGDGGTGGDADCVIPDSGPWPPCATGGDGSTGGDADCVIPDSGPWPPCATGGEGGDAGCVIPDSGPWPPCATGEDARPPSTPDCEVPDSGPWPPCARMISIHRFSLHYMQ